MSTFIPHSAIVSGLDPHGHRAEGRRQISGATVHFVIPQTDAGPIVMQGAVAVRDDDKPDMLAARILEIEHRIYPDALRLVASGLVRLDGATCKTAGSAGSDAILISPAVD
jgi:phosphoribosylglycinamide formyltransferase-1